MNQISGRRHRFLSALLALCISGISVTIPTLATLPVAAQSAQDPTTLFDPSSTSNWPHSAISRGVRQDNSGAYRNMFVSHPVSVRKGDRIIWGPYCHTDIVGSVYDSENRWIRDISFGDTEHSSTGNMSIGPWNYYFMEFWYGYTVQDDNAAYLRVQGNASSQSDFRIFKNLENGFADVPGSIDAASHNYFDAVHQENWTSSSIDENGSRLVLDTPGLFVTHPIPVEQGEVLTWNPAAELPVMAAGYDQNGNFVRTYSSSNLRCQESGDLIADHTGALFKETACSLTISHAQIAFIRLVLPESRKDDLGVYKNLPGGFDNLPRLQTRQVTDFSFGLHKFLPYRYSLPKQASNGKEEGEKFPLVLFLHGLGERGTDNHGQLRIGIQTLLDNQPEFSNAILLAPHLSPSRTWVDTVFGNGNYDYEVQDHSSLDAVMEILDQFKNEYPVDPDRIYVIGESMGGFGTWNLLMRYPDIFAAGIPICGGANLSKAPALKEMPIWTFHGDRDGAVPYSATVDMVNALKAAGSTQIRFTPYPGEGHEIWNDALAIDGLGAWLFSQRLSDRTGSVSLFDPEDPDVLKNATLDHGRIRKKDGWMVSHPIALRENDSLEWTLPTASCETFVELYDQNGSYLQTLKGDVLHISNGSDGTVRARIRVHQSDAASCRIVLPLSAASTLKAARNNEAGAAVAAYSDPLKDQSIVFAGDAILSPDIDPTGQYGLAGRMAQAHEMALRTYAKSKASLTSPSGHSRILMQMSERPTRTLVLSGGAADAKAGVRVGAVTQASQTIGFDTASFAGALEELLPERAGTIPMLPSATCSLLFCPTALWPICPPIAAWQKRYAANGTLTCSI